MALHSSKSKGKTFANYLGHINQEKQNFQVKAKVILVIMNSWNILNLGDEKIMEVINVIPHIYNKRKSSPEETEWICSSCTANLAKKIQLIIQMFFTLYISQRF